MAEEGFPTVAIAEQKILMDLQRYGTHRRLPASLRDSMTAQVYEQVLRDGTTEMVMELVAYVAAEKVLDTAVVVDVQFEVYPSWWEHTKAVFLPGLWRRLGRPARTVRLVRPVTIDVARHVRFPDLSTRYPESLRWLVYDTAEPTVGPTGVVW